MSAVLRTTTSLLYDGGISSPLILYYNSYNQHKLPWWSNSSTITRIIPKIGITKIKWRVNIRINIEWVIKSNQHRPFVGGLPLSQIMHPSCWHCWQLKTYEHFRHYPNILSKTVPWMHFELIEYCFNYFILGWAPEGFEIINVPLLMIKPPLLSVRALRSPPVIPTGAK